jgi:tellurite resistance protein TerB
MQQLLLEKLVVEARHWRNKELLKVVMAVFALAGLANGALPVAARQGLFQAFARNPALREFDLHKALAVLRDYAEALGADPAGAKAIMEAKLRRMAGKHKRARTALRLAYLILAAKGALPELERTEFRRLCALLDVEPEQVWEELGG